MIKRCTSCQAEYATRWRNEPIQLCPRCAIGIVLCAACEMIVTPPRDPAQLELLPELRLVLPRRVNQPTADERYWSLRAKASEKTKRKYPYH